MVYLFDVNLKRLKSAFRHPNQKLTLSNKFKILYKISSDLIKTGLSALNSILK